MADLHVTDRTGDRRLDRAATVERDATDSVPPVDAVRDLEATEPAAPRNWFTRRRLAKWNAPRRPRNLRWFIGTVGRVLIATGIMLFGFIAYQLWGTGLETARAQRALSQEFDQLLADASTTTALPETTTTTEPPEPTPTTAPETTIPEPPGVDQLFPPIDIGDPLAKLEIPSIGVDDIVVAGIGVGELQRGPGHFPETPIPGQLGNAALAGHRTTYGQPFRHVDQLEPGDEIIVTTVAGRFVYRVTSTEIVTPQDYHVVATEDPELATITLVSCHPVWSAAQRIVITGELDETQSDPVGRPIRYGLEEQKAELPADTFANVGLDDADPANDQSAPQPTSDPAPADDAEAEPEAEPEAEAEADSAAASGDAAAGAPPTTTPPTVSEPLPAEATGSIEDAFARGWFHDRAAFPHIAGWGALLSLIAIGSYFVSRHFQRDLVGFLVGVVPFAIVAFFFFQNVNRLLPPNL